MAYYDATFEARRKSIISGGSAPTAVVSPSTRFTDTAFEQRRQQVLTAPAPPVEQPVAVSQPEKPKSLFGKISDIVSSKILTAVNVFRPTPSKEIIPGGIKAGIKRVITGIKEQPRELFPLTSKTVVGEESRKYISDTVKTAVNTVKGAGKLTVPYLVYRAATGNPVGAKEYGKTLLESGLGVLNVSWRLTPAAPIVGAGFSSWKGVRQYLQGKIDTDELMVTPIAGVNNQPGLGEIFTDNVRWAEAIDIAFLGTMFVAPFAKKKLDGLNLKAEELTKVSKTLGVRPGASLKEVSKAFTAKARQYPDVYALNPNPERLSAVRELTDAYNIFKRAGVVEKKYAQAYDFIQSQLRKFGATIEPFKQPTAVEKPKLLTAVGEEAKPKGVKVGIEVKPKQTKPEGKVKLEKKPIPKELEPLAQEARKYKSVEEWIKKIGTPIKLIREGQIGDSVIIDSKTYGIKTPNDFNLSVPTEGEIVKINPSSVSIKVGDKIYKYPADAKITENIDTFFKGKTKSQLTDFYNQAVGETAKTAGDERLTLRPTKAVRPEEIKAEAEKTGAMSGYELTGRKAGTYKRPLIGVAELKTLLKNSDELKENPVLTLNADRYLEFTGKSTRFKINPDAMQLSYEKLEKLKVGDEIKIDIDAFKKTGKIQQLRVYKGKEVYAFNPKNLEDPESLTAIKETDKIIKKSEIAKRLSEKLGVPIRRGKFNQRALGIFKQQPKVVRIKRGGLQTIFHEVGHFLDDQFKLSGDIGITERRALMTEYGYKYEGQAKRQQQEALAEFLRFKMTGQDEKIQKFAPEFSKVWDKRMEEMPEVKAVIDAATQDFKRWTEQPAAAKILSHISIGPQNKMSLADRAGAGLHDLYTAALDDLHPLSEFSKLARQKLGVIPAEKDPYILARLLRGWTGKADLFLTKGTFSKNFWTVENGKTKMNFTGKSYSEIMKPVEKAGALDDFRVYIVAKRALELADRGIVTGIAEKDAVVALNELSKKYPDFEKISTERLEYKNRLLEYVAAPGSGLIGPRGLAKIKELNKYHVPFYRVMEETAGAKFMGRRRMAGNIGSPIKRIKGSEREIIDPLEGDVKDTYALINAAERNGVGVALANLAGENFELARLFERVDRPIRGIKVNAQEVMEKIMKKSDIDIEVPEDLADLVVTIFRPTQDRGPNMLNVNMGDKQLVFQVEPTLFKAIQGLNTEDVGTIMRILAMPAKLLRAGATLTPDFSLRNPIRDQFSAFIYSKYGYVPGLDLTRGMFELFKQEDVYNLWKAGGGEHSMLVSMDRGYLQKSFRQILRDKKAETLSYVTHPLRSLQAISELGEQGTRLGEMRRALRSGATPTEAAFASREVTLDFARIGAITRAVNLLVSFWNVNVQGLDKMVRSFKTNPFRTLFKVLSGITLPSVLLYFANRDDERWQEIPAWQKNLFWIIFTKNHIIRIPKPFEMGILFGSIPERILEFIDNKDPQIFDQLKKDIANGATPGFIPTALLPIIENISNYSFFLDRPIVARGKEGLPPEAQAGTYTSEISKIIGRALHYSPAKIDNLVRGYAGGIGRYTTSIIDKVLVKTGAVKVPPKPQPTLDDMPVIRAFMVREPIGSSSESVNRIYNMYTEVSGQVTHIRKLVADGEVEEAKKYATRHPEIINIGTLNAAVSAFRDINRARDQIMDSRDLTPEQKRVRIRKLDEAQTVIARNALKQMGKAK